MSSKSSVLPEKSARLLKNTHVDFIFVDAADKHDRMPLDTVDVDAMKMKGTYFASERFTSEEQFVDFIESNTVFGNFLSKNFFLYTIARQFTGKLCIKCFKQYTPCPSRWQVSLYNDAIG